jgi:hypothetical protein
MRAFEFSTKIIMTEAEAVASDLGKLLDKAKDRPDVIQKIGSGIDALLNATNKMVSAMKSKENKVAKPVAKTAPKPIIPPSQINKPVESLDEATVGDIPKYKQKIQAIEENIKLLSTMKQLDPKILDVIKNLQKEIDGFEQLIEKELEAAAESYKQLDPYIGQMLERMSANTPSEIAKMRTIFQKDEIPTKDAITFLQYAAQGSVIDMEKLIASPPQKDARIDDFVEPKVKKTFEKVIGDFFNILPQATGGNIGPGEVAFVLLGSPVEKVRKGDLKIGGESGEKYEIKAGDTKPTVTKKGTPGKPKLSGAILGGDKIPTGKSAWPKIKSILQKAGFPDVESTTKEGDPYPNYRLNNVGMTQFNKAIEENDIPVETVADAFSQIIKTIYPSVWDETVTDDVLAILKKSGGKIKLADLKPGEPQSFENNNELMRYITKKALETYRQDAGKENFIFFNKTSRGFKVYKGDEFNKDLDDPQGKLKVIRGVDWNDGSYKASPGLQVQ